MKSVKTLIKINLVSKDMLTVFTLIEDLCVDSVIRNM